MRWGVELPNGAGTPGISKTFLYTQRIGGTESWFRHLGSIPDQTEIEITEAAVMVVQNILCKDIPAEVTVDPLTTPTYASADTSDVWTGAHSLSNPLTINSVNYDVPRAKFTVNYNPEVIKPNGEILAKIIRVTNRRIAVELDTWKKDGVLRADAVALTARAATYKLNNTGPKNISLTDLYLQRYSKQSDAGSNAHQLETLGGTAAAITITA